MISSAPKALGDNFPYVTAQTATVSTRKATIMQPRYRLLPMNDVPSGLMPPPVKKKYAAMARIMAIIKLRLPSERRSSTPVSMQYAIVRYTMPKGISNVAVNASLPNRGVA
jgi:hypothetical protein